MTLIDEMLAQADEPIRHVVVLELDDDAMGATGALLADSWTRLNELDHALIRMICQRRTAETNNHG